VRVILTPFSCKLNAFLEFPNHLKRWSARLAPLMWSERAVPPDGLAMMGQEASKEPQTGEHAGESPQEVRILILCMHTAL